jgi:hypothetical protein
LIPTRWLPSVVAAGIMNMISTTGQARFPNVNSESILIGAGSGLSIATTSSSTSESRTSGSLSVLVVSWDGMHKPALLVLEAFGFALAFS